MTGPGQLVLRCVALVALLVGGIVASALTHAWWLIVATIACLIAAAGAVAISVNAMLGQDDRTDAAEPYRGPVAALAAVVVIAVVLAVALPMEDSAAVSTAVPDATSAAATVSAFLAAAVLDGNAYAACQYLAPSEQQLVAALAGEGQSCRTALSATEPSLAGVHSEGSLHALPLRVAVRNGSAFVASPRVMFVLRPATSAERSTFQAPSAAWRIVSGATALLA
jgi:hypothetical protein